MSKNLQPSLISLTDTHKKPIDKFHLRKKICEIRQLIATHPHKVMRRIKLMQIEYNAKHLGKSRCRMRVGSLSLVTSGIPPREVALSQV